MGSIMTIFLQPLRGQMDVFDVGTPAVREGWRIEPGHLTPPLEAAATLEMR